METTKIIRKKYIEEYCKANIDVHINYLEFLSGVKEISTLDIMELSPLLESVKTDLYKSTERYCSCITAWQINADIKTELVLRLTEKGLNDVINYLDYNLNKVLELTTALFLQKAIQELPDIKGAENNEVLVQSILSDIKSSILKSNLNIAGIYSAKAYLESLRIQHDEKDSIIKYVYQVLSSLKILTTLLNFEPEIEINSKEIDRAMQEFYELLNVFDINSLINSLSSIKAAILKVNDRKKHIEKQLRYDKIDE